MCMFLSPTPKLPQKDIVAMIFYRCAFVIPGAGWPVERGGGAAFWGYVRCFSSLHFSPNRKGWTTTVSLTKI